MGWRNVVITGNAKLDFKMDYMVIRKADTTTKIYIGEIAVIIIQSTAVSLTAMLLNELIKNKIKIIFCDEKHNPSSELVPYYGSHDTSVRIRNQMSWLDHAKESVWTEIVTEKINQQYQHLCDFDLDEQAALLKRYIAEVEPGDKTNREGHAAKVYFNALFGLDFTRSKDNAINAALNYGYGILLSCFNREIVSSGYITQLGLFHENMFNQFNFSSDLMEPCRVIVDRIVKMMEPDKFDREEKLKILYMFDKELIIDGKKQFLNNAISIYCKSIFKALNENDVSQIKFMKII